MPRIDLVNYVGGREQVYVKHCLLEKYLSRSAYKIGSSWDLLVFVDGFAGPWRTKDKDFADSSFGVAIRVLKEAVDGLKKIGNLRVNGACIFVEKKKTALAFPLISRRDLDEWIATLYPVVRLDLSGSKTRRKPRLFQHDNVNGTRPRST